MMNPNPKIEKHGHLPVCGHEYACWARRQGLPDGAARGLSASGAGGRARGGAMRRPDGPEQPARAGGTRGPRRRLEAAAPASGCSGGRSSHRRARWCAPHTHEAAAGPSAWEHVVAGATSARIAAAQTRKEMQGSEAVLGFSDRDSILYQLASVYSPPIVTNGWDCSALGFRGLGRIGPVAA